MSTKHVRNAADLARLKCGLKIECGGCGNARTLAGIEIAKVYGTKSFAVIQRRMVCSRCRARDTRLTVLSPSPQR